MAHSNVVASFIFRQENSLLVVFMVSNIAGMSAPLFSPTVLYSGSIAIENLCSSRKLKNVVNYVNIFTESPRHYDDDWIFQQNNTAVHSTCLRASPRRIMFVFWIILHISLI